MGSLQATAALQTLRSEAALTDLLAHPVQFAATASLAGGAESAAALAGLQGVANVIVVNPAGEADSDTGGYPLDPAEAQKRAKADQLEQAQAERARRLQEQDAAWTPPALDFSTLGLPPRRTEVGAPALVPPPSHSSDLDPGSDEALALVAVLEAILAIPPLGAVLSDASRRTTFLPPSARGALALGTKDWERESGPAQVLCAIVAICSAAASARTTALPRALLDLPIWSPEGETEEELVTSPYSPRHITSQLLLALQQGPGRGLASLLACELEEGAACSVCRSELGEVQRLVSTVLALPSLVEGEAPDGPTLEEGGSSKERRKRKRAALQAHAKLRAHPPPRPVRSVDEAFSAFWTGTGADEPRPRHERCEVHPDAPATRVHRLLCEAPALALSIETKAPVELGARVTVPGGASYKLVGLLARSEHGKGWVVSSQAAPGGPWRALDVSATVPWTSRTWRALDRAPLQAGRGGVLAFYTRQTAGGSAQPETDGGKRRKRAKKAHGQAGLLAGLDQFVSVPAPEPKPAPTPGPAAAPALRRARPAEERAPARGAAALPAAGMGVAGDGEDLGEPV